MKKYFVSSDIHSFYDEWLYSLNENKFDINNENHIIILCGDLLDRGNQSQECINFVKNLLNKKRLIFIRGNHEDLMLDCIRDINRNNISNHHVHNGTVKTIADLMKINQYDILCNCYDKNLFKEVSDKLEFFIENSTIDFYTLGDFIFVHGWLPVKKDIYYTNHVELMNLDDCKQSDWKAARWLNGMYCWSKGAYLPDKTIICGHYHSSYGNSKFHNQGEEFPDLYSETDIDMFKPFIDNNIIAIDGCIAYTRKVNVIVFREENGVVSLV